MRVAVLFLLILPLAACTPAAPPGPSATGPVAEERTKNGGLTVVRERREVRSAIDPFAGPAAPLRPYDVVLGELADLDSPDPTERAVVLRADSFFRRLQAGRSVAEDIHPEYRGLLSRLAETFDRPRLESWRLSRPVLTAQDRAELEFRYLSDGKPELGSLYLGRIGERWLVVAIAVRPQREEDVRRPYD